MKILLVHNYYGTAAPSGENQVFEAERKLLRKNGHEVIDFLRKSDSIRNKALWGLLQGAFSTPWNFYAAKAIRRAVEEWHPDIVHVHNTFPLLSPAIFHAIGARSTRVLTLHNYRLFCPAAIPMRSGSICTECIDRRTIWPALRYGCYRSSRLATIPLAVNVALHRHLNTWKNKVDAFIALTDFQRERLLLAGLPDRRVHVKPNFYPGEPAVLPWSKRRPCAVFAGRLTAEKGVEALVRAWLLWGAGAPELRILGDGVLREKLERMAVAHPYVSVTFLGQLPGEAAQAEIARAKLLLLPSNCFEGFPMVVREAFAFGTPVAVSNIDPLPAIVQHGVSGVVFDHASPPTLLAEVRNAWESPGYLQMLGQGARKEFEMKYTEEANYATLMTIYQQAIRVNQDRKSV